MGFHHFEDIVAWQSARRLVSAIYTVSGKHPFARDAYLRNQIRSAAISIMSNIAEGSTHRSDKEFARFLFMAKASISEVQSHLYIASDVGYLDESSVTRLSPMIQTCAKQVGKLVSYLMSRKPVRNEG